MYIKQKNLLLCLISVGMRILDYICSSPIGQKSSRIHTLTYIRQSRRLFCFLYTYNTRFFQNKRYFYGCWDFSLLWQTFCSVIFSVYYSHAPWTGKSTRMFQTLLYKRTDNRSKIIFPLKANHQPQFVGVEGEGRERQSERGGSLRGLRALRAWLGL